MRRPAALAAPLAAAALGLGFSGASDVTISVRDPVLRWGEQATLLGSIPSPKAEEKVVIEVKECGQPAFRAVAWAYTQAGGAWTYELGARASSQFRAAWGDERSNSVAVQQRPYVTLVLRAGGRGEVGIQAIYPFWGKRVSIQVFDKRTRAWRHVQSVKLTEHGGGGAYVWTSGKFRPRLPRNAQVRAVLILSQAKPCYLAGYSGIVQT